jgi:hypothetical protein
MSTLIRIEEVEPIEVGSLLPHISTAVSLILGLAFDVVLVAVQRFQREMRLPDSYRIEPGNRT